MKSSYLNSKIGREINDYVMITIGLVLYSISWAVFMLPYEITTGGVSGISAIIFYATGIEMQVSYFVINVASLIVALKILGPKFSIKTIYAIFALTFLLWLFQELLKNDDGTLPRLLGEGQDFMACVIGASLLGFSMGLIFTHNGSTGGTDIIAAIVNKYRDVSFGKMIMLCDIIIISSCYFIFHDWRRVVFGFTTLIFLSFVIDYVVNSSQRSIQFMIFSKKHKEIAEGISKKINRGVTFLDGEGGYSGEPVKVIVAIVKKSQALDTMRLVKDIDPNAFMSQSNVAGVYGQGFSKLK
jgi:uncharacterized membrane-anchored protein YitT (DUF2179 family)